VRMVKDSKPSFRRQESWRYKRIHENWRRPRGVTSKMRKEESGSPAKVKAGYGSTAATRGLHPRGLVESRVWRESELEQLDPKIHIVRIAAQVGERKRRGIVDKAKQLNFHIANPGKEEGRPIAEPAAEKELPASIEGDTPETTEKMSEAGESTTEAAEDEEESSEKDSE
jgi:large subunit ribosomal protein L32e